ncbi:LysR family transcriptional regulator [Kitasatospora sp. NPDC057015]|uniref:LysR family transcriptional regulator n=1 Tax=Kitasatospora sp. NPDC057015 TaxID=3346001 RepID=UPI003629C7DE
MEIDTRLLRSFAAVCEEGQLTAAAARLRMSQPALTKQIRQLEERVGAELFRRSRAGMTPTAAGNALAAHTGDLLGSWDRALRATREAAAGGGATLRVGFEGGTINLIGRPTLTDFTARMPGWQVEIRQNSWFDPAAGLTAGEVDLALWHAPPWMAEHYQMQLLGIDRRCLALSVGHRLAGAATVDFADLLDEPFVAMPEESGHWRDYWLGMQERGGHPTRIGAVAHNADEWLAAVACGQGIGLAPETISRLSVRPGVVFRPLRGLSPGRLGLYWPRERPCTPAMTAFIRSCLATVEIGVLDAPCRRPARDGAGGAAAPAVPGQRSSPDGVRNQTAAKGSG